MSAACGTRASYTGGCRCPACTAANTAYVTMRRQGVDPTASLLDTPAPGPWSQHARCRTVPHAVFFPARGEPLDPARAICGPCPVREDCLAYALPKPGLSGVWGGTSPDEREQLRRQASRDAAGAARLHDAHEQARGEDGALLAALEQLAAHPGQWARVAHYASAGSAAITASLLRTGKRQLPPGRWQFEGRRNDTTGSDLYAIYIGADQPHRLEEAS